MPAEPKSYLTPEEYLALERKAERKSEYFDGEMFATSGASREHNLIVTNIIREISQQLKERPCEVYPSDMRVKIPATGLYTYPDVVVVCGEPKFEDDHLDTLLNPTLIIEVLFESTEAYDRGKKSAHYRTVKSLAEYLLVAQDAYRIEQYVRQASNQWLLCEARGLEETLRLSSIQCDLTLKEVYAKVTQS
jgi:Uma2 family endonuclease